MVFPRLSHVRASLSASFILWNNIPSMDTPHCVYPFITHSSIWCASTLGLLFIMQLCTFMCKLLGELTLSVLLCMCLGVELLCHMVTLYLTCWGTTGLFSKVVAPPYNPTSDVWVFQFLHILVNTCYCVFFFNIALLVGMKLFLTIVLVYISLKSNGDKHLFMNLLSICISSSDKCLFKSFALF